MLKNRNSAVNFLKETAKRFGDNTAMVNGEDSVTFNELKCVSAKIGTLSLIHI